MKNSAFYFDKNVPFDIHKMKELYSFVEALTVENKQLAARQAGQEARQIDQENQLRNQDTKIKYLKRQIAGNAVQVN